MLLERVTVLCDTVAGVPALETFVKSIRRTVTDAASRSARPGAEPPPAAAEAEGGVPATPRQLLEELRKWADERIELAELRVLREALTAQLGRYHVARAEADEAEEADEAAPPVDAEAGGERPSARRGGSSSRAGSMRSRAGGRGGGPAAARLGAAEEALARTVAEAIGDGYAEAAAAGGLSAGGVCAALREMTASSSLEDALRRVRGLVGLERDLEAKLVELALILEVRACQLAYATPARPS